MIEIGQARIDTNVFLAPLAGCADLAFRLIAREHGAKFCFFEMVDSNSLVHSPSRRTDILKTIDKDTPIAAQILGEDPEVMLRAAKKIISSVKIPFLDINAACPTKKVIKKRSGSHLLKNELRLLEIVKLLSSSLPIPVTVKIRLGYETESSSHIVNLAKRCESSGAQAIFVHGRTSMQGYSGSVNYNHIKHIKESLRVPVFGIGDIFTPQLAKKMFDSTGCDGIMVARGSMGNPWIFKEIDDYLNNGSIAAPLSSIDKKATILRHVEYIHRYKECNPRSKVGVMRKTVMWYLKGLPRAARLRSEISIVNSYEKMLKFIDEIVR